MKSRLLLLLACLLLFLPVVSAQYANKRPTAGIDQAARKTTDLGYNRTNVQDSVLNGAPGSGLPPSRVTLPDAAGGGTGGSPAPTACQLNPTAPGCPDYCTANPSALGCPGYCLANPAAAGCGGSGGGVLPPGPVAAACPTGQTLRGYFWEDTGLVDDVGWCGGNNGPGGYNFPVAGVIGASCNASGRPVGHAAGRCTGQGFIMPVIECKARCN